MIVAAPEYTKSKYKLHKLKELEDLVAESVEINIPFNNYITGFCAFTHKAGIHAKAILNNPSTYGMWPSYSGWPVTKANSEQKLSTLPISV